MRRQTLGPISGSALNTRPSIGRPSLGGRKSLIGAPRASDVGLSRTLPRQSIDPAIVEQRRSTAARRSSAVGVRGAADPRPLTDKEYMNDCIAKLIDFLLNHGYDQRMDFSVKGWRPTGRDFQNISCFLFKELDPNWQCGPKFEDEFILVFKTLGYPYTISKTSLSAVGSPHAWPQLLGAIDWLVGLLTYDTEVEGSGGHASAMFQGDGDDMTRQGDATFMDYLYRSYGAFLTGDDVGCAALEQDFVDIISSQATEVRTLNSARQEDHARLLREIEAEKQTGAMLPAKKAALAHLESDNEKLGDFVVKLREHLTSLESKVVSKRSDVAVEKAESDSAKEEIKALKARIGTQELSADEAQRMVAEKERLERTLSEATCYNQSMRQKAWEADMELGRRVEELERVVHSYTAQATALQLLPRGSKNAQDGDFRILVNKERLSQAASATDVLSTDVTGSIMPALNKFKDLVGKKATEMRSSLNILVDQEDRCHESLEEAADQLEELQARNLKLDEVLRREKEGLEAALQERAKEHSEIEEAIELLRDNPAERERRRAQQQQKVAELKSLLEEQTELHSAEANRAQEQVLGALGHIADYKAHVSRSVAEARESYSKREQAIRSIKIDH